jgi:hypothetical protein
VYGVDGMAEAYNKSLAGVELSGPTYVAPVLREFLKHVKGLASTQIYSIMVLMTDGMINDLPEAKNAIVELSYHPCSLIIVGVGSNIDWGKFEQFLKAGGSIKNANGQIGMREILEFVPFNKLKGNLSEDVLKKVPLEFMTYMEKTGVVPKPM